ncbi:MAG TPA: glycosyltransferase family 4 protein [Verrucomicrobiae bacterium]|nr:glycosyltransferase family 4 protein [Verrucomicrobiae bacterium]
MNIVQITPGAGAMFCGNCFRDNALVAALRRQGHSVLMVPLYLPLTLDEEDQTQGVPIFFNGVNVYLEQKSEWYRTAPRWLHRLFASPSLLKFASGRAAKTRAADLGDITLSMIRGEDGNQIRELDELIAFLKTQPKPDIICLSNALLAGLARKLKSELGVPIACVLQGEDTFLDVLPDSHRALTWKTLAERCADIDLFIPPTQYFARLMRERLNLPEHRVRVIYNGINLDGFELSTLNHQSSTTPTLGYFARMCREKGLDTLVEAFIILKERDTVKNLKLKIGGGCGPSDLPVVERLRDRLRAKVFLQDVEFHPNVDRAAKQAFLRSLSVFSVPALYGEAFGLYVIEALASGVPVVQPRHAAFPELVEISGGGVLCEPGDAKALANALEPLLLDSNNARALGAAGRKAVEEKFNAQAMANETIRAFEETVETAKPFKQKKMSSTKPG